MQQATDPAPRSDLAPSDAVHGNWVDRYAPPKLRPFLRLARLDRPIGTWLLLLPCWWSVALAELSQGKHYPSPTLLLLFAAGALLMRGSGCAYNDWVDRDYDAAVARTAGRPIPSGQVSPTAALLFAVALALAALFVLICFNAFTIGLGIASLGLVFVYPFMKRFTDWPQLVLGLAFNWGALLGWAAVTGSLALAPILLYVGSVCWTVGYDTIYAHQDAEDDASIGLKSTALRFAENTKPWVGVFYAAAVALWAAAGYAAGAHAIFHLCIALVALHFVWQVVTLDTRSQANCLSRFRSNRDVGLAVFIGIAADMAALLASASLHFG